MLSDLYTQEFSLRLPDTTNNSGIPVPSRTEIAVFKWRLTRSSKQHIINLTEGKVARVQWELYTLYCDVSVPILKDYAIKISGHFYLVNTVYVVHDALWPHHLSCDVTERH